MTEQDQQNEQTTADTEVITLNVPIDVAAAVEANPEGAIAALVEADVTAMLRSPEAEAALTTQLTTSPPPAPPAKIHDALRINVMLGIPAGTDPVIAKHRLVAYLVNTATELLASGADKGLAVGDEVVIHDESGTRIGVLDVFQDRMR